MANIRDPNCKGDNIKIDDGIKEKNGAKTES